MPNDLITTANQRATASPIVRSLANRLGVPLAALDGTGAGGRITAADVRAAAPRASSPAAPVRAGHPGRRERADALATGKANFAKRQAGIPLGDSGQLTSGMEEYAKRRAVSLTERRVVPALPSLSEHDVRNAG